jgi:ureidoacrylate peracid hydrolase
MHASEIPAAVLERANATRGDTKSIEIIPAKTAHVVIDLQVGFMAPTALVEVPAARAIVPRSTGLPRPCAPPAL